MFRMFKKIDSEEFSTDEKKVLIQDYLHKADDICYSFELRRRPYFTGGVEDLDKLIYDLTQIRKRIIEIESKELIEERNFWKDFSKNEKK